MNVDPTVSVTHPDNTDLNNDGKNDTLKVEKQSFNGDEWTGVLILPDNDSYIDILSALFFGLPSIFESKVTIVSAPIT